MSKAFKIAFRALSARSPVFSIVALTAGAGAAALLGAICLSLALLAGPADALPPGRVYEMVSPIYKAGYGVTETLATAPDGDSVAFTSLGGFAGLLSGSGLGANAYLARRTATGWSTTALQPPAGEVVDFSETLGETLGVAPVGANSGQQDFTTTQATFVLHQNDTPNIASSWQLFGEQMLEATNGRFLSVTPDGADSNLCHEILDSHEAPLLSEAIGALQPIYDFSRGCGGEPPGLRLVAVKNRDGSHGEPEVIDPNCPVELGVGSLYTGSGLAQEQQNSYNSIARAGNEIFFSARGEAVSGETCTANVQLFARLAGSHTIEISRPLGESCTDVPCPSAAHRASSYFKGASEDGSRVYFTSTEPLTPGASATGKKLYLATLGCPSGEAPCEPAGMEVTSLTDVSRSLTPNEPDEVQGVVRIAPDGSRAYFVARAAITQEPNAQSELSVKGADNLYAYDAVTGEIAFIGDLCSGAALSGAVEDPRCPADPAAAEFNDVVLWESAPEAQAGGPDGRYFVFATDARLLPGDTDNAKDVYRYDAASGELQRISIGASGFDANGNAGDTDATIPRAQLLASSFSSHGNEMSERAVSADGTRIVFTSAANLTSDAKGSFIKVYEWHEGQVALISGGNAQADDQQAVISPSGRDIFFTTTQGLVPEDLDGVADVYDARLEGGFPPPPAPRQPCSGDACQGPLTSPPPLLVPGSVSQAAGENLTAVSPAISKAAAPLVHKATPRRRHKTAHRKHRRKSTATRRVIHGIGARHGR